MATPPSPAAMDLDFWSFQDSEHNLFFALGVIDPTLAARAADLHARFERARAAGDWALVRALFGPSQAFKVDLFVAAQKGWVGWIFPTFVDHTHREIEYALQRIATGPGDARAELCFWTRIGAEHAAFAAHLLDPSEAASVRAAMGHADRLGALHAGCGAAVLPSLAALSKAAAAELDRYFGGLDLARVRSVIHPALAAHVVREGRRFLAIAQNAGAAPR